MTEKTAGKGKIKTELSKAVKNIKKHIESGSLGAKASQVPKTQDSNKDVSVPSAKRNEAFKGRGIVYLSHIPHGFYEKEMHGFFNQFGRVTRLRLVRSHKTGNSCGYAFIEFLFSEVAQVVAETMNNYLMRNRLLKAQFIPSEKQNPKMFLHSKDYGPETCLGLLRRRRTVKVQNRHLSDEETNALVNRQKDKLQKLQEKLKAQGVDFLFQVDNGTSNTLISTKSTAKPSQASENESSVKKASGKVSSAKNIVKNVSVKTVTKTLNSKTSNANAKPANAKVVNTKSANAKTSNAKPANAKKAKTLNAKTVNAKTVNTKTVNAKTVNAKTSAKTANGKIVVSKTITKSANAKTIKPKTVNAKTVKPKTANAKAVKSVKKISTKKIAPKKK